jgi:hypothetical protein
MNTFRSVSAIFVLTFFHHTIVTGDKPKLKVAQLAIQVEGCLPSHELTEVYPMPVLHAHRTIKRVGKVQKNVRPKFSGIG